MFPDWYARQFEGGKVSGNLRRSFEMGGVGRAQKLDQRWLDQIMPIIQNGPLPSR